MIEDNPADVLLVKEALQASDLDCGPIRVLSNGEQAMDYINGWSAEPYSVPCAILLDINLPRIDGWAILRGIKAHPVLRHVPVVVMSSSSRLEDADLARRLGAYTFFPKPIEFESFLAIGNVLSRFIGNSAASAA